MPIAKHTHPNERNLRLIKKPHAAPPILSESQNQNQRIPLSVPRLPSVSEQNNGGKNSEYDGQQFHERMWPTATAQ